jgi:hypothetical protein
VTEDREQELHYAEVDMDKALTALQKTAAAGANYGHRVSVEARYAEAYGVLVRLGARPRLRTKYRV